MSARLLEAKNLWLDYAGPRTSHALRGIDLAVESGSFVGVMGPSGAGKSSLLCVLAGLRQPSRGEVSFRGTPWPFPIGLGADRRRVSIGFVFQEPFLVPHWTIAENLRVQQFVPRRDRIVELASRLGIARLLDEFPDRLSAGERQRASVARALVNDPLLILADEPTSCLDSENGLNVMNLLTETLGRAALVVCTHDHRMLSGASQLFRMEDGTLLGGD